MPSKKKTKKKDEIQTPVKKNARPVVFIIAGIFVLVASIFIYRLTSGNEEAQLQQTTIASSKEAKKLSPEQNWIDRAFAVTNLFHLVYTPCWEGAYGALGDAYLFAATKDSSLLRFHLYEHDMRRMCEGTWVDDRAWICLAELKWWEITGKQYGWLVQDARHRYLSAKSDGRLSHHDGFWSWYNWAPHHRVNERIFTNSNMNQMITVACELYRATNEKQFLEDALLVWNGDNKYPGIEKELYKGKGVWEGAPGLAAFGKQIPWNGAEFCAIAGALYKATDDKHFQNIVIETARHVMNPANGWVDGSDYYQIRMDGNGAFVNFLLDGYAVAPDSLPELLPAIEKMLNHVWTNNHGMAAVTLHREADHGIRNGWNPNGGEDGYNVGEIGTVHAQGEAARAFGVFAYYKSKKESE